VTKGNLWGFIQSRPYASVADIRRLFMIDADEAASVTTTEGTYYVGLSQEAANLIRQLWHEGRIVLDTNPDVKARAVQGIYPARAFVARAPGSGQLSSRRTGASEPDGPSQGQVPGGPTPGAGGKRRRRRRRAVGGSGRAGSDEASEQGPAPEASSLPAAVVAPL
jgi:hypothetical protein